MGIDITERREAERGRQREREKLLTVLSSMREGVYIANTSYEEVGEILCISSRTVDHHRANIMQKLNLKRAADLHKYAISKGYVS